MRKPRWFALVLAALVLLLATCGPTPAPITNPTMEPAPITAATMEPAPVTTPTTPESLPASESVRNAEDDVSDILYAPLPETDDGIRRVINDDEYQRMLEYVQTYIPEDTVVTSVTSLDGDRIACVDVYRQPALIGPRMAGHVLQFQPEVIPQAEGEAQPSEEGLIQQVYQTGEMCPEGTIPIRYPDIEVLVRFRTLEDYFRKYPSHLLGEEPVAEGDTLHAPTAGSTNHHQYAVAQGGGFSNRGVESRLSLWDPYTEKAAEFSLSQIWAYRGSSANLETVEAGWQEYHDLYSDWRPRLFIYYTPDNYGSGCYNLTCGAFVQVNHTVYIGGGFTSYSKDGGSQYEIKLLWYKDGTSGSWWLRYANTWVGYYPISLFDANGLRDEASYFDFGGEIVDTRTDSRHTRTDMGSGNFPAAGYGKAAFHRCMRYVDSSSVYRRATGLSLGQTPSCYEATLDESPGSCSEGSWEVFMFFGGTGYNSSCQ